MKTVKILTQAGHTGLQTVQSCSFDLRLYHIHSKWTKLAKLKNTKESWPYLFVKQNYLEMPTCFFAKINFIPFVHWHADKSVKGNLDSSMDTILKIGHLRGCHD